MMITRHIGQEVVCDYKGGRPVGVVVARHPSPDGDALLRIDFGEPGEFVFRRESETEPFDPVQIMLDAVTGDR